MPFVTDGHLAISSASARKQLVRLQSCPADHGTVNPACPTRIDQQSLRPAYSRRGRGVLMRRIPMPVLLLLAVGAMSLGFLLAGVKAPKD